MVQQQETSADVLGQLVETLRLEPGSAHVQHALVRVRRADNELANALNDGTESEVDAAWVRLRSRLEELEEAFLCSGARGLKLAADARAAGAVYDRLIPQAQAARRVNPTSSNPALSTDDDERRRKLPSGTAAAQLGGGPIASTSRPVAALPPPSSAARSSAFDLAYTSHLLATSPSRVLPPGKTLHEALHARTLPLPPPPPLAIESAERPERRDQRELVEGRLTQFVKALASSSSAETRTHTFERLKAALWNAAKGLLGKEREDGIPGRRRSLEAAFRPDPDGTAFDVNRATGLLHSLAVALADLCSAARDVQTVPLIATLSAPDVPSRVTPDLPTRVPAPNLSLSTLVEAARDLICLCRDMTHDMDLFKKTVASALDDELMVRIAAWENERTAINLVYPGPDAVQESVVRWLVRRSAPGSNARTAWLASSAKPADADAVRGALLTEALVDAIFADTAVGVERAVGLPGRASRANALPSILVIQSPAIFRLQNFVQALTIVACLASLAGVPAPHAPAPDPLDDEWAQRLWTLLHSDEHVPTKRGAITFQPAAVEGSPPVVLSDLADEVLRIRRLSRGDAPVGDSDVEDRVVRASVTRIIQSQDPVYKLLKARARDAVKSALRRPAGLALGVPVAMHTGIMGLAGKKADKRKLVVPVVKGFSRQPILGRKLLDLAEQVAGVVSWSADVWGDSLGFVAV